MSDIIEEFMEEDTQKGMYMTFKSGREHFGIAIKYVNEIIEAVDASRSDNKQLIISKIEELLISIL